MTFTINDKSNKTVAEKKPIALKLHKQFGHPVDKKKGEKEWRGAWLVLGIDGKQVIVRHGWKLVRVSPCSLQHVNSGSPGIQSDVLAYE